VHPQGTILINQQEIHPVTVSSGLATYPDSETVQKSLEAATPNVFQIPGLSIAQELGNVKVLNVVLLGALSSLLPVELEVWEGVLKERAPSRFMELNLEAFHKGRGLTLQIQERKQVN